MKGAVFDLSQALVEGGTQLAGYLELGAAKLARLARSGAVSFERWASAMAADRRFRGLKKPVMRKLFDQVVADFDALTSNVPGLPSVKPTIVDDDVVLQRLDAPNGIMASFDLAGKKRYGSNKELKLDLEKVAAEALKERGIEPGSYNKKALDHYVDLAVADAEFALRDNSDAVGWYNEKVSKALRILSLLHPEIRKNKADADAFKWILAVTSNGMKVNKNFELAEEVYRRFKKEGRMPEDMGIGTAKKAMNQGLALYNTMVERFGKDTAARMMMTVMKAKEVRVLTGKKPSGEYANADVLGASILGPKIGNGFYANLNGEFDQLTIDRWLMATWGRWTGNLVDEDQALIESGRNRLREAIGALDDDARGKLEKILGIKLDPDNADNVANKISAKTVQEKTRNQIIAIEGGDELRLAGRGLAGNLDGQRMVPTDAERPIMRDVMGRALERLRGMGYEELSMADLQALLWYPEKRLYDASKSETDAALGYDEDEAPDYENAAAALVMRNGVSKRKVTYARRAVDEQIRESDRGLQGGARQGAGPSGIARPGELTARELKRTPPFRS